MNSLQLAPHNESMRLGQGYNSFLQLPRVHRAVTVDPKNVTIDKAPATNGVAQVVSYSSRLVSKLSEVTRTMNITSGASIKAGAVTVSGNQTTIDETKFSAADINAVISVKVINQTMRLNDNPQFNVIRGVNDESKFHRVYGDSYISGFIEGGEFHSIISIRVLDSTRKEQIVSSLKRKLGNTDPRSFSLTSSNNSSLASETKQTETSIFVNWCGGGQIKSGTELWTLDSVFRAASAFPNRVALNPQRCWAILTRYTQNLSFHASALKSIPIRNYANVNPYAADLLDDYMEYKANLLSIKKVLDEPIGYALGPGSQPVDVRTEALVAARRKMKEQMGKIVDEIEVLNNNPASLPVVMKNSTIESPEVWATRLPKRRTNQPTTLASPTPVQNSENVSNLLKMFNFANEAARKAVEDLMANPVPVTPVQDSTAPSSSSLPILATESAQSTMTTAEKTFVNSSENRRVYGALFRFDQPGGTPDRALNFNDAETIQDAVRAGWPTEITFQMVVWGTSTVLGLCRVGYTQLNLSHGGSENAQGQAALVLRLGFDERVVRLRIGFGPEVNRVKGVRFIEVWVTPQGHRALGDEAGCEKVLDCAAPDGFVGLKGFYGYEQSGKVVERIGVIWGK
ncbi:hypothetical protein RSOLAG22IIIB_07733 [Rhizoctonia solani]|uniref:Uncharacterized protein n=1 Tax=Rhizoctonia solani TaxID=456999 RepID=A0A0K6FPZ6_9AGAM|nr:hypothetical protein RSOLAG22IIIB_07733 [Rhizoctonia solani]